MNELVDLSDLSTLREQALDAFRTKLVVPTENQPLDMWLGEGGMGIWK